MERDEESQGSEWERVIVAVPRGKRRRFVDRALLYTAATRARAGWC